MSHSSLLLSVHAWKIWTNPGQIFLWRKSVGFEWLPYYLRASHSLRHRTLPTSAGMVVDCWLYCYISGKSIAGNVSLGTPYRHLLGSARTRHNAFQQTTSCHPRLHRKDGCGAGSETI